MKAPFALSPGDEEFRGACRRLGLHWQKVVAQLKRNWVAQTVQTVIYRKVLDIKSSKKPGRKRKHTMPPRGRRPAATGEAPAPSTEPPGGAHDLLSGIEPSAANGALGGAANDPFDFAVPTATSSGPAASTIAPPSSPPTPDPFNFAAPIAVQGFDGLQNAVTAQAIEKTLTKGQSYSAPDPIIHGSLQDLQVKVGELLALKTTVEQLVTLTNTTAREQTLIVKSIEDLHKLIQERTEQSRVGYHAIQGVLNEVVQTLGSFQTGLNHNSRSAPVQALGVPAVLPDAPSSHPVQQPTGPVADKHTRDIVRAVAAGLAVKRQIDPKFQAVWANNPPGWFTGMAGICGNAGISATPDQVKTALQAAGMLIAGSHPQGLDSNIVAPSAHWQ